MIYQFDTNAVADYMTENPLLLGRLRSLPSTDRAIICPIVRGEVLFGIARLPAGRRKTELAQKVAAAFGALPCEPIRASVGDIYAQLRASCEAVGQVVHENDLWIAAFALDVGAAVVTRDADLRRVSGLHVEDWTI